MTEFNVDQYHAEIDKLREYLRVMDVALNDMKFESGPCGVSLNASGLLARFNDASGNVDTQLDEVIKAMLLGMKDDSNESS